MYGHISWVCFIDIDNVNIVGLKAKLLKVLKQQQQQQ